VQDILGTPPSRSRINHREILSTKLNQKHTIEAGANAEAPANRRAMIVDRIMVKSATRYVDRWRLDYVSTQAQGFRFCSSLDRGYQVQQELGIRKIKK
jgi:hypothetical protein